MSVTANPTFSVPGQFSILGQGGTGGETYEQALQKKT